MGVERAAGWRNGRRRKEQVLADTTEFVGTDVWVSWKGCFRLGASVGVLGEEAWAGGAADKGTKRILVGVDVVDAEGLKAVGAGGEWSGGIWVWFGTGWEFAEKLERDVTGQVGRAGWSGGVVFGRWGGQAGASSG